MGATQLICCLGPPPSPAPSPTPSPSPRASNVRFRVLIIGRANAGKTSILQRVCDTTESPIIHRSGPSGTQSQVELKPTIERGLHDIEDELTFTNHNGYVFHDSRGFEAGSEDELKMVQEFVIRKSREKQLNNRLHAIWYCIPMESARPSLDLKHFGDICTDKNVPVIAVFTKFDQFKRNIKMKLEDEGRDPETHIETEVESVFDRYYLGGLSEPPPFVRLERMHKHGQRCTDLIEVTANALNGGVVTLMLTAVQRDNLELSVKKAVEWTHEILQPEREAGSTEGVIRTCMTAFPAIWYWNFLDNEEDFDEMEDELGREDRGLREDNDKDDEFKLVFNKLTTFYSNPRLCISTSKVTYHTMIVTILILEYATVLYASSPRPTREDVLDKACFQFISSNTYNAANRLFLLSPKTYSTQEFIEFVLTHRLR